MKRVKPFFVLLMGWAAIAGADPASGPLLRTKLETSVAVPGQVIVLEVTVLVPTWMPEPPELPAFELPDVSVRLPEGSSRPAMERIEGETWSGVTREYQISPMVVGRFRIPSQTVTVTYADPETRAPTVVELRMEEVVFEGRAPAGAEDLDPFIAAESLTLEQSIEGDPQDLEPGAAFTRVVTARLTGASPIFVPPLIPPLAADGLAAYPKEPVFRESNNRGRTTGERVERVTYVAAAGGRFDTAPIRLRWWNLRTKQIEVAQIPALEILSRGPPPAVDLGEFSPWLVVGGLCVVLAGTAGRWLWPRLAQWRRTRRERRLSSEAHAFDQVVEALRHERFGDAVCAVELWSSRVPLVSEAERARLSESLESLGAVLYGSVRRPPSKQQWSRALISLRGARRQLLARSRRQQSDRVLPPLNPGRAPSSPHG